MVRTICAVTVCVGAFALSAPHALGGQPGVVSVAAYGVGGDAAQPVVAAAKKRGCAAKRSKAARAKCQKARKRSGLRKGQVCSLSKDKQAEYARAGFVCLDVSANQDGSLTYLEDQ